MIHQKDKEIYGIGKWCMTSFTELILYVKYNCMNAILRQRDACHFHILYVKDKVKLEKSNVLINEYNYKETFVFWDPTF